MRMRSVGGQFAGSVAVVGGIIGLALTAGLILGALSRNHEPRTERVSATATEAGGLGVEGGAWKFSRIVLKGGIGVLGVLALVALGQTLVYRHTRVPADPDSGILPVTAQQRREGAVQTVKAYHKTRFASVQNRSGLPQGTTHLNIKYDQIAELAAAPQPQLDQPLVVPTYGQLIRDGALHKDKLPVAYTESGELLQGTTKELRSGGYLAQSGGGKSNGFAGQISWARYCDRAVFLGDLHAHLPDSTTAFLGAMAGRLYAPVAGKKTEVLEMMLYLRNAWEVIMEGGDHELAGREVAIWLDEITGVAARDELVKAAVDLVGVVGREGGKANWCIWVGGQQGTKASMGGGVMRDGLKTRIAGPVEKADAGRWLDVSTRTLPENMKYLDPGEVRIMTRAGLVAGRVPLLTGDTIDHLVEAIDAREKVEGVRILQSDPVILEGPQQGVLGRGDD